MSFAIQNPSAFSIKRNMNEKKKAQTVLPDIACFFDRDWVDPLCTAIAEADSVHGCMYFFSLEVVMNMLKSKLTSVVMQCPTGFMDNMNTEKWHDQGMFNARGKTWLINKERVTLQT